MRFRTLEISKLPLLSTVAAWALLIGCGGGESDDGGHVKGCGGTTNSPLQVCQISQEPNLCSTHGPEKCQGRSVCLGLYPSGVDPTLDGMGRIEHNAPEENPTAVTAYWTICNYSSDKDYSGPRLSYKFQVIRVSDGNVRFEQDYNLGSLVHCRCDPKSVLLPTLAAGNYRLQLTGDVRSELPYSVRPSP